MFSQDNRDQVQDQGWLPPMVDLDQLPPANQGQLPLANPEQLPLENPWQLPLANPGELPLANPGQLPLANPGQLIALRNSRNTFLPSSEIPKHKLRSIAAVLTENSKLRMECTAGTLCQTLAKQAIFGKEVMKKCTPNGTCEHPGLPRAELFELKRTMFSQFPRFHSSPEGFEPVWKKCMVAIEQACKRLRS